MNTIDKVLAARNVHEIDNYAKFFELSHFVYLLRQESNRVFSAITPTGGAKTRLNTVIHQLQHTIC
jgi:hypothetical protein